MGAWRISFIVGSAAMVGIVRISGSTIGLVRRRLRLLLGMLLSDCKGLVDVDERVRMHQQKSQLKQDHFKDRGT